MTPERAVPSGTRSIATLPGFLSKRHAWQLFQYENILNGPKNYKELSTLWQEAKRRAALPPVHRTALTKKSSNVIQVTPLPKSVESFAQELMARSKFECWYADHADYQLWCIPACILVTPQWYADLDYIKLLTHQAPRPGQWKEALEFVFGSGCGIDEPLFSMSNANTATVTFRSPGQRLSAIAAPLEPPQIRRLSEHEFEIAVQVQTVPNYLQVARMRGIHVLVNGIHHSCALLKAGWEAIPCLVRKANSMQEIGFVPGQPGAIAGLEGMQRLPYICDFLEPTIAHTFLQRMYDQVFRIILQTDNLSVPR